jgi:hypothetical protein
MTVRLNVKVVLVRHDVPLIVLAERGQGAKFFCLNLDDGDSAFRWLVVKSTDQKYDAFVQGRVDARYLFLPSAGRGGKRKFWLAEFRGLEGEVFSAKPYTGEVKGWLPESGFFFEPAPSGVRGESTSSQRRRVSIQGRWELPDLRRFSDLLQDAYAFVYALRVAKSDAENWLGALFARYPWRGGLSSVKFFDDLYEKIPRGSAAKVLKIHYASPGYIDFAINAQAADYIRSLVRQLGNRSSAASAAYYMSDRKLRESKWYGTSERDIKLSTGDKKELATLFEALIKAFGLAERRDHVFRLAAEEPLAAVKILMAFYRRLDRLADYVSTGKAADLFAKTDVQRDE